MKFNYYYGSEADQFSFIRIPKVLLIDEKFKILSIQSKMLYGMLLDRMGLSMKNSWFDSENKVYIIYKISEIQKDLGFSKRKAMDYLMELEAFGLVEKKKRGFGLPSILYVKSFMGVEEKDEEDEGESIEKEVILKGGDVNATSTVKAELKNNIEGTNNVTSITQNRNHRDMEKRKTRKFHESCSETANVAVKGVENNINGGVETDTTRGVETDTTGDAGINISRGAEIDTTGGAEIDTTGGAEIDTTGGAEINTSRGGGIDTTEVLKSIPLISKTKYSNIKESDNECINTNLIYSNLTTEKEEMRGKFDLCMDDIKNKIEYENLIRYHKDSKYVIDEIVKLIFEVLMCEGDTMVIASNKYPLELVKNKFLKLDYTHIQYVLEGFNNNTTKINNIRKYMLASLFNAESTMSSYYTAQANYDLRGN